MLIALHYPCIDHTSHESILETLEALETKAFRIKLQNLCVYVCSFFVLKHPAIRINLALSITGKIFA